MATRGLLVILSLLLMLSIPVHAQSEAAAPGGEWITVAEDPSGDVEVSTQGQKLPDTGRYQSLDVTRIEAKETADSVGFRITLAGGEDAILLEAGSVRLTFVHHDQRYRIVMERIPYTTGLIGYEGAALQRHDPAAKEYNHVTDLTMVTDGATIAVDVAREYLTDAAGAQPYPGRTLSEFHATTQSFFEGVVYMSSEPVVTFTRVYDAAPDTPSTLALTFQMGLEQTGHIRLGSPTPMRASNGEATTFVYDVIARSLTEEDSVRLQVSNVPPGWEVDPSPGIVRIGESLEARFAVRVDLPFAHQHGTTDAFLLEAISARDEGSVGRIELGVHYLDVPQPSGHHDTLFVHSRPLDRGMDTFDSTYYGRGEPIGTAFMNTVEDFDGSMGAMMPADQRCILCIYGADLQYTWTAPLSPSLRLGIDMDLQREGKFVFQFTTPKPMPEGQLRGEVHHVGPDQDADFFWDPEGTIIATLEPMDISDAMPESSIAYEGTITPTPEGDYIEYERGGHLYLVLRMTSDALPGATFGVDNPMLHPGGWLQLPLDEYADTVADFSGFTVPAAELADVDATGLESAETKPAPGPAILAPLALLWAMRRRD